MSRLDYSAWVACPSNVQRALLLSQSDIGTLTLLDADNNLLRELTGWSGLRLPFLSYLGGDGLLHLIKVVNPKPELHGEGQMLPIRWYTFDPDTCHQVACKTKLFWPLPIDQMYHAQSGQALGVDLCGTGEFCQAWLVVVDAITLQEKSRMELYTAPSATVTFGGAFWNHDGSMVAALMYHELPRGPDGPKSRRRLGKVHIFDTANGSRLLSLQLRMHLDEVTVCWSPTASLVAVHQIWSRPPRAAPIDAGASPADSCDLGSLFGPEADHGLVIGATGSAICHAGFGMSPDDNDGLRILDPAAQQVYVIRCRTFPPAQADEHPARGSPGPYMSFKTCEWSPCGNLLLAGWRLSSAPRSSGFSIYARPFFGSAPEVDPSPSVLDSSGSPSNMTWRTVPGVGSRVAAFFPSRCLYVLFEKVGRHWHALTTDLQHVVPPGQPSFLDPHCKSLIIHAADGYMTHLELAPQTTHRILPEHQQHFRYEPPPQWAFPAAWSPVYAYVHTFPPQPTANTGPSSSAHKSAAPSCVVLADAARHYVRGMWTADELREHMENARQREGTPGDANTVAWAPGGKHLAVFGSAWTLVVTFGANDVVVR